MSGKGKTKAQLVEEVAALRARVAVLEQATPVSEARLRAEEALKVSELRFRSLIEQTTDAVFCYEFDLPVPTNLPVKEQVKLMYDCTLVACNDVCARSYGDFRPEDVIGRNLTELFGTVPGSLDKLFRAMVEGDYRIVDGEGVEKLPDGTERYFLNNGHGVVEDGKLLRVWGTFRDITERKRAEEALRESEARFRALFEQAGVGVNQTDTATGQYVRVNQRYSDIVGYTRDELEQLRFQDITHPDDLQADLDNMKLLVEGEISEFSMEKRLIHKNGSPIWVHLTVSPMWAKGGPPDYHMAVIEDITERRRAEEALRRSAKVESLGVLAGGVAHDFNNLLTTMGLETSLARSKLGEDHEAIENLGRATAAMERATDLARQMLAYSGRGHFQVVEVDLNQVVEESANLLRSSITSAVTLTLDLSADLPFVEADPTQIEQVLMNLVLNAAEACGASGRVEVVTGLETLDGTHEHGYTADEPLPDGEYVCLEVRDNGVGIDADTLGQLFDPFFSTKATGRGLGLSTVLGVVRSHKGDIHVASEVGEGSSFKVLLPVISPDG